MADWKNIKAEYIKGGTSYSKLSKKHGVSFGTLKRRAGLEGWKQLRDQCSQNAITKIIDIESDKVAERYTRVVDVADKLLTLVEKIIDRTDAEEIVIDKSALKQLSGTLKDIKDIQSLKSGIDIEEQKAKIKLLNKQAESNDNTPSSITVTIAGGEESWQQ